MWKEEMHTHIADGKEIQFVVLRFFIPDVSHKLHWEDEHEFEFQGNMYDVIQTTVSKDSVFYTCLLDYQESAYNRQLEYLWNYNMYVQTTSSPENTKHFIEHLKKLYYFLGYSVRLHTAKEINSFLFLYVVFTFTFSYPPITPPPWIL